MEKDDWYRDRILWQAKKHSLLDESCREFSDLAEAKLRSISNIIPEDINPVLVFWRSQDRWTVLGTRAICSYHGGKLVQVELDEIAMQISLFRPTGAKNPKLESSFLRLEKSGELIWAPPGPELFALWNILRMFPLGVPAAN